MSKRYKNSLIILAPALLLAAAGCDEAGSESLQDESADQVNDEDLENRAIVGTTMCDIHTSGMCYAECLAFADDENGDYLSHFHDRRGAGVCQEGFCSCTIDVPDFCADYDGQTVALETSTDRFIRMRPNMGNVEQQTWVGTQEPIDVSCQSDGTVCLESNQFGTYLRSDNYSSDVDQQTWCGAWERWTPVYEGGGEWSFLSNQGRYLHADPGNPGDIGTRSSAASDTLFRVQ